MLLAAVDLGSNSFRLEIGRVEGDHIDRHGYWKETVRLAAGLDAQGRLTRKAMDAACATLARMNERLRGLRPDQVRAVGTQTLRSAGNADEFLREAERALGHPIEVIAGREEARLVFEGCMHTLPRSDRRRLVVDIGGASTELIIGRGYEAERAESFKVGCVNTTLRFFEGGAIDRASFKRAQVAAAAAIEEAALAFAGSQWDEAYGSSGTAGAVADILRAEGWTDGTITAEGLQRLRQAIIAAGEVRKLKFAALKPDRQEVLAGGTAVLCAVFESLGIGAMHTARGALRVGLLYDLLGRREERDLRDATVDRLQQRFGVDRAQAQRVAQLARQAHGMLVSDDTDSARRLQWAAALHEVGFAIAHDDYHKHGAYLVRHGDLAGFSTRDQEAMALMILAQRGNLKKVAPALADPAQAAAIVALRLAVLLCHARQDPQLPPWTLRQARGTLELRIAADWLEQHPLTAYLLEEEQAQWARLEKLGEKAVPALGFVLRAL